MRPNKGDVRGQRKRRKDRYQGCRICGVSEAKWCAGCRSVDTILALHARATLSLYVDGSFVTASGERDRPRVGRGKYAALRDEIVRTNPDWTAMQVDVALREALIGKQLDDRPGHGGAGLVLVTSTGVVIATRSCAFAADNSSEAERQAVIRGARWASGVTIYTDSESTCVAAASSNKALDVRFLPEAARTMPHEIAHTLSVEGRQRQSGKSPP